MYCNHTWIFAPWTDNTGLRCSVHWDGHTALCGWHAFWLIMYLLWVVGVYGKQQLFNILNIISCLLPSNVWHREGAHKYLLILELWMNECRVMAGFNLPSSLHCLWLYYTELVEFLWHIYLVVLYCSKTKNKCILWRAFTYVQKVCMSHWGFIPNKQNILTFINDFQRLLTARRCPLIIQISTYSTRMRTKNNNPDMISSLQDELWWLDPVSWKATGGHWYRLNDMDFLHSHIILSLCSLEVQDFTLLFPHELPSHQICPDPLKK